MVQGADRCELNQGEKMYLPGAARKHRGGAALIARKAHLNPGHKYDPILTYFPPS